MRKERRAVRGERILSEQRVEGRAMVCPGRGEEVEELFKRLGTFSPKVMELEAEC